MPLELSVMGEEFFAKLQRQLDTEYEVEAMDWIRGGMKSQKKKKAVATVRDPNTSCIRTVSGKLFYPFKPSPKDVDLRDIAHGLSHICRFTGQCLIFWSVAQHAMLAADLALALSHSDPRIAQLLKTYAVLHHDDPEAYITDLSQPIKIHMDNYRAMEDGVTAAVNTALQVNIGYKDFVKACDNQAYQVESSLLFDKTALNKELNREGSTFGRLARLSFAEVKQMFLDYSDLLSSEIYEEKTKSFTETK